MIDIKESDIDEGLKILMNVPQLNALNTKDNLRNIIKRLLQNVYIDSPKELLNYFSYDPNQRMVNTIFKNYGILPTYYEKLNPIIQRKLVYYLEILFQQKGNLKNLEVLSVLFKDFFQDINYYNISVNKLPIQLNGVSIHPGEYNPLDPKSTKRKFITSYFLKPLVISNPDYMKYFPNFEIDLTGKYLMRLKQYENFEVFPRDTNIVYMDFIDSSYLNFSDKYLLQLAEAYTFTKHQHLKMSFNGNDTLKLLKESIPFVDLDLMLTYFNLRFIRFSQTVRKLSDPNNSEKLLDDKYVDRGILSTSLIFPEDRLDEIELLAYEYKKADNSQKTIKNLSRRWQYLIQTNKTNIIQYENFEELEKIIQIKYPSIKDAFDLFENVPGQYSGSTTENLTSDELKEITKMDYINFLMNLYINTLNTPANSNEFTELIINSKFQNILNSGIFIEFFFAPIFKLFTNYFMPGVMEFIYNSNSKIIINDRFERISVEDKTETSIKTCLIDNRYAPCNIIENTIYIDYLKRIVLKDSVDMETEIFAENLDSITFEKRLVFNITRNISDFIQKSDMPLTFVTSDVRDISKNTDNCIINILSDVPDNISIHDKKTVNIDIQSIDTFTIKNTTQLSLFKQKKDNITIDSNIVVTKNFGNFFKSENFLNDYIWKIKRLNGITQTGIPRLEDYQFLKQTQFENINAYLFYN